VATSCFVYDQHGQLDALTDVSGGKTAVGYNADREATEYELLRPGKTRSLRFPSTHRPGEVTWNTGVLNDTFGVLLTQDNMERIGQRYFVGSDTSRVFSYDQAGRLIRFEDWLSDPDTCGWDEDRGTLCVDSTLVFVDSMHYSYDKVGNRTDTNATVQTGNRLAGFGAWTMTWDEAGFLTSKSSSWKSQTFWWNALGQLDSLVTDGVKSRHEYDGFGRRTEHDYNGAIRRYVYDGEDVFLELNSSNNVVAEYTFYPGTDHVHSMKRGGEMYFYAQDQQGTVLGLFDDEGAVVNKYRDTPWGNVESTSTTVYNPIRHAGAWFDPSPVRLVYLRNRYYDPHMQRFISKDPIGLAGGINPYVYAGNDPVNRTDRFGLSTDCLISGVATYEWDAFKEEWDLLSVRTTGTMCLDAGRGGGGGGSGSPPPPDRPIGTTITPRSGGECLTASLLALATFGADLATLTGAGLVGKLLISSVRGYVGRYAARQALVRLTPQVVKGAGTGAADLVGTAYAEYGVASLTGQTYLRLAAGETAKAAGSSPRDDALLATSALGNGFEFDARDLIPGWAFGRSLNQAVASCFGGS